MERRNGVRITPVLESLSDLKPSGPMIAWESPDGERPRVRIVVFEKTLQEDGGAPQDLVLEEYLGTSAFGEPAWRPVHFHSLMLLLLRGLATASGFERVRVAPTEQDQVYILRDGDLSRRYPVLPTLVGWRRRGEPMPELAPVSPAALVADGVVA